MSRSQRTAHCGAAELGRGQGYGSQDPEEASPPPASPTHVCGHAHPLTPSASLLSSPHLALCSGFDVSLGLDLSQSDERMQLPCCACVVGI